MHKDSSLAELSLCLPVPFLSFLQCLATILWFVFLFVFVMLLDSCFLLCCLSLPMPSPFPIGGMSAKHLQKIVFKLPCHSTVMCLRISTIPSSLISMLLHLIAAVSPTHHQRLLCCILLPTAAAKTPTTFILFFLSTMWTALPIHDSTHSAHPPFKHIINIKFYSTGNIRYT